MAYCSQSDLLEVFTEDELIRLTDDDNTGSIDSARVTAAISKADALIDGYCRAQNTVPFESTPALIADISVSLSAYYLWKRRRRGQIDEERKIAYDEAIKTLEGINRGTIQINNVDNPHNTGALVSSNKTSSNVDYTSTVWAQY